MAGAGRFAPLLLAGWLAGGCAVGGQPVETGQPAVPEAPPAADGDDDMVRQLATQCYWRHEGERLVFGGGAVYHACHSWAERTAVGFGPGIRVY